MKKDKLYKMNPNNYANNGCPFNYRIDDTNYYLYYYTDIYSIQVNQYGESFYIYLTRKSIYDRLTGIINRESCAEFFKVSGLSEL